MLSENQKNAIEKITCVNCDKWFNWDKVDPTSSQKKIKLISSGFKMAQTCS